MVKSVVLTMVIAATIIQINSGCIDRGRENCKNPEISNATKNIVLQDSEFILSKNQAGYELTILDSIELQLIREIEKPEIKFCVNGKMIIAKGNPIFSSSIPEGVGCFYPLSNDGKIIFSFKNKIMLSIIDKIIH